MPPHTPRLIYRSLLWLLGPYLRWRFWREGRQYADPLYASQRRGDKLPQFSQQPLWMHAASVGEFNALLPLLETLHTRHPNLPLLLTTNTVSSGALARKKLPAGITHAYLPVDKPAAMQRFLTICQPQLGVIMETELWPNLYRLCHEGGIPLVIINGRLSSGTLAAPHWLRQLYRDCLQHTSQILARSELDRERFLKLGARPERCRVIGNIKFTLQTGAAPTPVELGQEYVLAASSRDDEEKLIVEAWQQSAREALLVIAPRHPQRLPQILQDLQPFDLPIAVRSRGEQPTPETRIYIADTFGELRGFMAGAQLVFMGGSLVEKGGHNILEPAALGKAIITGPHMEHFSDECQTLLQAGGIRQVESVEGLAQAFTDLLSDTATRTKLEENAQACVAQRADMAERYLEALQSYIEDPQTDSTS